MIFTWHSSTATRSSSDSALTSVPQFIFDPKDTFGYDDGPFTFVEIEFVDTEGPAPNE